MVSITDPESPLVTVVHVGPHIDSFGGTQTVIRVLRDGVIGADRVAIIPTWHGSDHVLNARLTARAARAIVNLDRRTIVHFHVTNGGGWLREVPLIAVARAVGLEVVVTLHAYDFPEFARRHSRFVRSVLSRASHVICLSPEAADQVVRLVGRLELVTVMPNPVVIDTEAPPVSTVPPAVLFAGRVSLLKGVDVLVEAWRQILERGIPGTCRIVGPITDYDPPRLDRLSIEAPVHPTEIARLLREVRVVVLPSRAEAMPMILTEALAAGRPFVATSVGAVASITPDPDMLVPIDDPGALADAIGRYLADGAMAELAGRRGQRHVADTRSTEVIGHRLRQIYSGLL